MGIHQKTTHFHDLNLGLKINDTKVQKSEVVFLTSLKPELHSTDNALTSSRQAVSEGLTTAHQLTNVDWKNKPIVQEKPLQHVNNRNKNNNDDNSNFLLDQERPAEIPKQESPLSPVDQEKRPQQGINNNDNFLLDQARPVGRHKQKSQPSLSLVAKPLVKEKNGTSSFHKVEKGLTLTDAPSVHVNSTRVSDQSLASSSANTKTAVLGNDLKNNNFSQNDLQIQRFANASLAKSNASLENSTVYSSKSDQLSKKPYTAAEYLQTLYPQLSAFKAPLEKIVGNASLQSSLSALLHDNGTLRKLTSLAPKLDTKGVLGKLKSSVLGPDKIKAQLQRATEKQLLASLEKVDSMLGERSSIKQIGDTPRYIKTSDVLRTRSKNPEKQVPVYRSLTESGAKLLPAHIFSPLGSAFGDRLEPPSTPSAKTTISTTTSKSTNTHQRDEPAILPTQAGQIHAQTQSSAEKESLTVPVIVPTQSGMISKVAKVIYHDEQIFRPTSSANKSLAFSEAFIPPTMATKSVFTKTPYVPTQSGFIPAKTLPIKTALPTGAPLVPTQIGFIPSGKRKGKIWTGLAEDNSERKDVKPNISRQWLSAYHKSQDGKGQPKSRLTHFYKKSRERGETHYFPHLLNKHMANLQPAHSREKRQMFVPIPLMQTNNYPQQFGQTLLPDQLVGQGLLPNLPQMSQLQQSVQQFLPTQPLQGLLPQLVQSPQAMDPMSVVGQQGTTKYFENYYTAKCSVISILVRRRYEQEVFKRKFFRGFAYMPTVLQSTCQIALKLLASSSSVNH